MAKNPSQPRQDSPEYRAKKAFFKQVLTIYGRKPVLEALQQEDLKVHKLHLASSNRQDKIISEIYALATNRDIEIQHHDRAALARISKNGRQDQGVVLDLILPSYRSSDELKPEACADLIALEGITNPQNLGMIIRAVAASPCAGLILPLKGNAAIDPLVIKASAGTVFRAKIYHCESALNGLQSLQSKGFNIIGLTGQGTAKLRDLDDQQANIFVMGNETHGLSPAMLALCDKTLAIPLANGVESLNVAVAASLMAFRRLF